MPSVTTIVAAPVPETRVRILSSTRTPTVLKKTPPPSAAPGQNGHDSHPLQTPRHRKHSSVARALPRRDSPLSNSPASSSPKNQSRKLSDPVDLVTVPQLDNVLPSDSRYPLPSRASSRSTPSPALNTSARASPTPDGGRGSPTAKDVTSPARLTPRGSRPQPQPQRSDPASQHPASTSSSATPSAPFKDMLGPAYQNVPVRGRPLIFAAMSVAPSEIGDVELASSPEEEPVFAAESYDTSTSSPPHGYPSPVSSGRRSPQKLDALAEKPRGVRAEAEVSHRPRKLSKTKKLVPPMQQAVSHPSNQAETFSQAPAPSHEHLPRHHQSTHSGQAADPGTPVNVLGPPFQLQQPSPPLTQVGHHGYSSGEESPRRRPAPLEHNKSSRHGVKALTDKQLEKLKRGPHKEKDQSGAVPHASGRSAPQQIGSPPQQSHKQLPTPPTPPSPEDYAHDRSQRRGRALDKSRAPLPAPPQLVVVNPEDPDVGSQQDEPQPAEAEEPPAPQYYPLVSHVASPILLSNLLCYLAYFDWCQLSAVSRDIRQVISQNRELEELVLERYLRTVGYDRWNWKQAEPFKLTLQVSSSCLRICIWVTTRATGPLALHEGRVHTVASVCSNSRSLPATRLHSQSRYGSRAIRLLPSLYTRGTSLARSG